MTPLCYILPIPAPPRPPPAPRGALPRSKPLPCPVAPLTIQFHGLPSTDCFNLCLTPQLSPIIIIPIVSLSFSMCLRISLVSSMLPRGALLLHYPNPVMLPYISPSPIPSPFPPTLAHHGWCRVPSSTSASALRAIYRMIFSQACCWHYLFTPLLFVPTCDCVTAWTTAPLPPSLSCFLTSPHRVQRL